MMRLYRSAKSRLSRDHSSEDGQAMGWCSEVSTVHVDLSADHMASERPLKRLGAPRASLSSAGPTRLSRSRFSGEQGLPVESENVAPMVQHAHSAPIGILGDVTNTSAQQWSAQCIRPSDHSISVKVVDHDKHVREAVPVNSLAAPVRVSEVPLPEIAASEDPQQVLEYVSDIYRHLQREDSNLMPHPAYMDRQPNVNAKMRAVLVDWLVDVHKKYKLKPETLFLAIGLVDRYLERRTTAKRVLQLVGVTALLIAAKFEELYPPQINDFVYVTDKAYTKEEVIKMEALMLAALEFKICRPTAVHFLERYQVVNGCSDAQKDLTMYLLELTLVDYRMVKYSPSMLAAASVLLSNKLLHKRPSWSPALERQTKFTESILKDCAKEMCSLLEGAEQNTLQAVRKKYSQLKHHAVAKLTFGSGSQPAPAQHAGSSTVSAVAPDNRRASLPAARRVITTQVPAPARRNSIADGTIIGPWSACAGSVFDSSAGHSSIA